MGLESATPRRRRPRAIGGHRHLHRSGNLWLLELRLELFDRLDETLLQRYEFIDFFREIFSPLLIGVVEEGEGFDHCFCSGDDSLRLVVQLAAPFVFVIVRRRLARRTRQAPRTLLLRGPADASEFSLPMREEAGVPVLYLRGRHADDFGFVGQDFGWRCKHPWRATGLLRIGFEFDLALCGLWCVVSFSLCGQMYI